MKIEYYLENIEELEYSLVGICPICKKIFKKKNERIKFCSISCSYEANVCNSIKRYHREKRRKGIKTKRHLRVAPFASRRRKKDCVVNEFEI